MSRKRRIEYPGAMYHVMNRGDQRKDIFRDDDDREKFLSMLGEACGKTEWQVHYRSGWSQSFRQWGWMRTRLTCLSSTARNWSRTTSISAMRERRWTIPGFY
jgi:hypothetical protein